MKMWSNVVERMH